MADDDLLKTLPSYKCHKVVRAAMILHVNEAGSRVTVNPSGITGGGIVISVPGDFFARGRPPEGDSYLVVYDDGYLSWSPAQAFEEGYSILESEPAPK